MQYYIKQQLFSWKDRFTVKDARGNDRYFVEGELFSFAKKLRVWNVADEEVLYIEQKLWNWLPTYHLYIDGMEVAQVKKEFTFLRPRYAINGPDWDVEGNVWEHNYTIRENGRVIADVRKEWFTWGDSYVLNIQDEAHAELALGIIIVIDCVLAASQNASS